MFFRQVSCNARPTCPRLPADARHSRTLQLHVVSSSEQVLVREGERGRRRLVEASLAADNDKDNDDDDTDGDDVHDNDDNDDDLPAAGGHGQPHDPPMTVRAGNRDGKQLLADCLATAALALKHTQPYVEK